MTQTDTDALLGDILERTRVIALVGYSQNEDRPSHKVARYLTEKGFRVIPVNPGLAGQEAFGEKIQGALADIPDADKVDMLDIFRRSDAVEPIVDEALAAFPNLRTVWMQIGVENAEARAKAEARDLDVVENRCPKIEHARLIEGIAPEDQEH